MTTDDETRRAVNMTRHQAERFLAELSRDISAARLRVTIDNKLGRPTPEAVRIIATLPYPPTNGGTRT